MAYLRRASATDSLWVRQLATQSDAQIVPAASGRSFGGLGVTPDGNYVDFIANENGTAQPALWRVPLLGGTPRRLIEDVWSGTGWSPDGQHMAFVRTSSTSESIVITDADGGHARILATRKVPEHFLSYLFVTLPMARPSWSSDGRSLLVLGSSEPRNADIERGDGLCFLMEATQTTRVTGKLA